MAQEHCMNDNEAHMLRTLSFWLEGVTSLIVIAIGLTTNIVTVIILSKKNMRHTFNSLLIALVAIDIGFLFFKIWDSIWRGLDLRTTPHTILFPKFLYPMNSITLTASIYMIVAISIERYRTLCYPTNSAVSDRKKLALYIGSAIGLAIVINFPKFFEASTTEHDGVMHLSANEIRLHPTYVLVYVTWIQIFATFVNPMLVLMFCNFKVYRHVVRENRGHDNVEACDSEQEQRLQETKLAIVLMSISLALFLCHLPRGILNIYEGLFYGQQDCIGLHFWVIALSYFSHLLLTINSSINIVFYVMLNQKFREHFLRMVPCFGQATYQANYERQEMGTVFSQTEHYTQVEL